MTDTSATETTAARRTKRRYAHELYPQAEEFETRPLTVEVPYLYARAIGMDVYGTGWTDLREPDEIKQAGDRTRIMIDQKRIALLADALLQGLTGDEAWAWADQRHWEYEGELLYERAKHYGVPIDSIKPYPCGPEPGKHPHLGEVGAKYAGVQLVTEIDCPESECPECTEEIPAEVTP